MKKILKGKFYKGCENADSATAKVVSVSTYDYSTQTTYFGDIADAIKHYAVGLKVDELGAISLRYYELFAKDLDTKKWVAIDVDDEEIEKIWASSKINPANKNK